MRAALLKEGPREMSEWAELRDELMEDPATRAAYEELRPQYELARQMIALRVAMGLTQKELADRTGMTQPAIARLESGEHAPKWGTLTRVLQALNANMELTGRTPKGKTVRIELFRAAGQMEREQNKPRRERATA